jgi:uncharacterized pyridoxal phosphate-containing UPF0001 family protein
LPCRASRRDPASVKLIAVSKTSPSTLAKKPLGQRRFGENRVQEAKEVARAPRRVILISSCISSDRCRTRCATPWNC